MFLFTHHFYPLTFWKLAMTRLTQTHFTQLITSAGAAALTLAATAFSPTLLPAFAQTNVSQSASSTVQSPAAVETEQVAIAEDPRPKVLILNLAHGDLSADYHWWYNYDRSQGSSRGISDLLVTELLQNDAYVIVDNSQLAMHGGSPDDQGNAIVIARNMDVDAVITGSITQFDLQDNSQCVSVPVVGRTCHNETAAKVQISLRMVNPRTGNVLAATNGSGQATSNGVLLDLHEHGTGDTQEERAADELLSEAIAGAITDAIPAIIAAQNRM